jgi:hypothetical protein
MFFQPNNQLGINYLPPPPPLRLSQTSAGTGRGSYDPSAGFGTYPTTSTSPTFPSLVSNPNVVVYPGSSGNNIFQTVSSLISQTIAGFSRNPTIQVGTSPTVQTPLSTTLQSGAALAGALNPPQQQTYPPGYNPNNPGSLGGGLGSGLDGIVNWITQNPLIVLGVGVGFYLLMREPPRRR